MKSFVSALFLALAVNFAYVKAIPNPEDDPESDEIAGFEIHDDAYCNNPNPRWLSIKNTDCQDLDGQTAYIKAVNYKDDLKEDARELLFLVYPCSMLGLSEHHADIGDTVQCFQPGDCPNGQGFGVPYRDGRCNYVGNMGGLRLNYP